MMKSKLLALLLPAVFCFTAFVAVSKGQEQISDSGSKARKTDVNHFPIAEFASSESKDPKRRARGEKRNKSHWRVDPDSISDSTVRVDSVDLSLPALPINESQAVIIGTVSDAKAYLSNDKTGVYSVFVVSIEEVLKHSGKLTVGSAIEAEREGGRVKFPSGRTHLYMISEQDMPRVGGRYLFFLSQTNTDDVFEIITGYEIRPDSVSPLDQLPQARAYENAASANFLNKFKTKLANETTLNALDEKIRRDFEETLPGWKHKRVEPIVKAETVLIEFWSLANKGVKISILPHESIEKAHEVFKNFDRYSPNKQVLNDLGDEAIGWGYGSADVAFRKGKFTVYISAGVDISADPDFRSLSEEERIEREKSQAARLNREFARHIVRVLDAL